jgi:hypothetical protein
LSSIEKQGVLISPDWSGILFKPDRFSKPVRFKKIEQKAGRVLIRRGLSAAIKKNPNLSIGINL